MFRRYHHMLIASIPHVLFFVVLAGTLFFLASFLSSTWRAISTAGALSTLKNEVAMETLDRPRFDRVLKQFKEKIKERVIDWKKIHDPL